MQKLIDPKMKKKKFIKSKNDIIINKRTSSIDNKDNNF